jgi:hypothetical protein
MKSKIVQIAIKQTNEQEPPELFALCEDGTLWVKRIDYWDAPPINREWSREKLPGEDDK